MAESGYRVRVVDTAGGCRVFVQFGLYRGPSVSPEIARVLADRLVEAARDADRQDEGCAA